MLTYEGANALLEMFMGTSSSYKYRDVYLGLSLTTPERTGEGKKEPPAENGYARVLIGQSGTGASREVRKMSDPTSGRVKNKEIIYFPEATDSWGSCTHFLIFDQAEGGTLLAYEQLTEPISPVANNVPLIRKGDLIISIT